MALGQKQIIAVIVVVAIAVTIGGIIFALPGGEQSVKGVTYHGNGGHTDAGDDTWKITNDTVIPCIFESDTGRVFKEWNTKADGSGIIFRYIFVYNNRIRTGCLSARLTVWQSISSLQM